MALSVGLEGLEVQLTDETLALVVLVAGTQVGGQDVGAVGAEEDEAVLDTAVELEETLAVGKDEVDAKQGGEGAAP